MKDFEALKDIWTNQVEQPKVSHDDILKRVKKSRMGLSNSLLVEVSAMILAVLALIWVWFNIPFSLWTSHAALLIFMGCCIFYIYSQIRDYKRISNAEGLLERPEEYIDYLKTYKRDRYLLNTRKYRIYTAFISFGFLLYFIEIFFTASILTTVLGILFTVIWTAVCYFWLMKIYIRKEEAKLNDMIENLERLQKQFEEEPSLD